MLHIGVRQMIDQLNVNRTWFPILLGVLTGMFLWLILTFMETPSFYRLSILITGKTSPKELFSVPGYYWIHRSVLLILALIGGSFGVLYSRWPRKASLFFLSTILVLLGIISAFGFQ